MEPTNLGASECIAFETRATPDYRGLLAKEALPAETIRGFLFLPLQSAGRLPLVVISIGSQGFASGREALYSRALTEVGMAAFVVDSFGPRGFQETETAQGRLSMAGSGTDALHAILHMREDHRIDPLRIGILGYSRGGQAAVATHHRALQQAVLGRADAIAAHVALYPSLNPRWRNPDPTEAPMLILVGEADELAPAATARAYAKRMAAQGAKVEVIGVPDGHHGFDSLAEAGRRPAWNMSRCRMMIEDAGGITEDNTGFKAGGDWGAFLASLQPHCGSFGGTVGHGTAPREVAVPEIQRFLLTTLVNRCGGR